MPADPESTGWLSQVVTGLGLSTTALGGWIFRTSNRQARIEEKLDNFKETTNSRLDSIDDGVQKIRAHITGVDL